MKTRCIQLFLLGAMMALFAFMSSVLAVPGTECENRCQAAYIDGLSGCDLLYPNDQERQDTCKRQVGERYDKCMIACGSD